MPKSECPYCHAALTGEEQMGVQCPVCQKFFESRIRPDYQERPQVTPAPSPPRTTQRSRSGSGIGSAWWLIPVAIFGVRACSQVANHSSPPKTDFSFKPPFQMDEYDHRLSPESQEALNFDDEELQNILERIRQQQTPPYTEDFAPPTDLQFEQPWEWQQDNLLVRPQPDG